MGVICVCVCPKNKCGREYLWQRVFMKMCIWMYVSVVNVIVCIGGCLCGCMMFTDLLYQRQLHMMHRDQLVSIGLPCGPRSGASNTSNSQEGGGRGRGGGEID